MARAGRGVVPSVTDRHAPRAMLTAAERAAVTRVRYDADEIEDACPGCTAELTEHG